MVNAVELTYNSFIAYTLATIGGSSNEQVRYTIVLSFWFIPERSRVKEYFNIVQPLKASIKSQFVAYYFQNDKYRLRLILCIARAFRINDSNWPKYSRLTL